MQERTNGGNLIAAVILSVMVLIAWDYFFMPKEIAKISPESDVSIPATPPLSKNAQPNDTNIPVQDSAIPTVSKGFEDIETVTRSQTP